MVIVDTIGDLFSLYGAADLAFVGGSLVPHGGQNILEPAAWGRRPSMAPTWKISAGPKQILEEAGAGIVVSDAASLAPAVRKLLHHPEREDLGRRAQAALAPHQGAARRQAELIAALAQKFTAGRNAPRPTRRGQNRTENHPRARRLRKPQKSVRGEPWLSQNRPATALYAAVFSLE